METKEISTFSVGSQLEISPKHEIVLKEELGGVLKLPSKSMEYLAIAPTVEEANLQINAIQEHLTEQGIDEVWINVRRSDDDRNFEVRVEYFLEH